MAASASVAEEIEHKLEDVSSVAPPSFAPPSMAPTPIATAAAPPVQRQPSAPVFRNDIIRNDQVRNDIVRNDQIRSEPANIATPLSPPHPSPLFQTLAGSAAAPAPAKEAVAPAAIEPKAVAVETATPSHSSHEAASASVPEFTLGGVSDAPSFGSSFGSLDEEDTSASARKKKILIVAAAVLVVAALAYVGYGTLGKSATAPTLPPVTAPQQGSSAISPMSTPAQAPSNSTSGHTSSVAQILGLKSATSTPLDKASASSANPPVIRIAADTPQGSAPETTKKSEPAPIVVKSNGSGSKLQTQNEDSAPLLANSATSADDSKMNGLMSSSSSSVARPSLAALKVSQGISQGLVIKRVQPKYPPAALSAHTQGEVLIEATINKEGNVINPKVIHGDSMLARAALDAVRQWRYKPYYLDGEPVEIQTQITINFKAN